MSFLICKKKLFLANKGNKINKIEKKYVGCFHAAAIHVVISVLLFLLFCWMKCGTILTR